ncbi:MAG: hypothetical protein GY755_11555 [Chloroflexi bacterium]|nr:hypothetical protein [Chloroflexota bacterium]
MLVLSTRKQWATNPNFAKDKALTKGDMNRLIHFFTNSALSYLIPTPTWTLKRILTLLYNLFLQASDSTIPSLNDEKLYALFFSNTTTQIQRIIKFRNTNFYKSGKYNKIFKDFKWENFPNFTYPQISDEHDIITEENTNETDNINNWNSGWTQSNSFKIFDTQRNVNNLQQFNANIAQTFPNLNLFPTTPQKDINSSSISDNSDDNKDISEQSNSINNPNIRTSIFFDNNYNKYLLPNNNTNCAKVFIKAYNHIKALNSNHIKDLNLNDHQIKKFIFIRNFLLKRMKHYKKSSNLDDIQYINHFHDNFHQWYKRFEDFYILFDDAIIKLINNQNLPDSHINKYILQIKQEIQHKWLIMINRLCRNIIIHGYDLEMMYLCCKNSLFFNNNNNNYTLFDFIQMFKNPTEPHQNYNIIEFIVSDLCDFINITYQQLMNDKFLNKKNQIIRSLSKTKLLMDDSNKCLYANRSKTEIKKLLNSNTILHTTHFHKKKFNLNINLSESDDDDDDDDDPIVMESQPIKKSKNNNQKSMDSILSRLNQLEHYSSTNNNSSNTNSSKIINETPLEYLHRIKDDRMLSTYASKTPDKDITVRIASINKSIFSQNSEDMKTQLLKTQINGKNAVSNKKILESIESMFFLYNFYKFFLYIKFLNNIAFLISFHHLNDFVRKCLD